LENAIKFLNKSLAEHRTPDILNKLHEFEKLKAIKDKEAYRNPQLSEEARERGNELFKKGDFSSAIREYNEAIARNDKDAKNYSNRAACYMKLMAFPEADKDVDKALELDPNFVKAYIRKAAILYAKRDFMKAIDVCNEAKIKDLEKKHTAEIDAQVSPFSTYELDYEMLCWAQ
jgi:stress-induced-phosphoprotein 1